MDNDAHGPSLGGRVQALEEEQRELRDRLRDVARLAEIVMGAPGDPRLPPRPAKHKTPKDQRWLHVVPGCALLAAGAGWLLRTRARRFAAGAATAALLTGGTLAPDLVQPVPAAQVPAYDHDAVAHHHHRAAMVIPAAVPVRRKRRRLDSDETVRPSATVTPAASPAPTGSPLPVPVPSPTVTPDPGPTILPTPVPTCTNLTGKHCHPGNVAGEVTGWPGALRGLPG